MATLRDKRIFLMRGGKGGESTGIYTPKVKPLSKPIPKVISQANIIARQQTQVQVAKEEDKIELPSFAFEKIKVLSKSLKDKI